MNNTRRKALSELKEQVNFIMNNLFELMTQEESCRDNTPEGFQYLERYEKSNRACSNMLTAMNALEGVIIYIEGAME